MAKTYTQLYVQFVFAVANRASLILPEWENELQKYITGIVQNYDHKLITINGIPNHQHVFVGMDPKQSCSKLMEIVKCNSSKWINKEKLSPTRFNWQDGFGAFSYSKSHVPFVCRYIENQKQHHSKVRFRDEYLKMLQKFGVDYQNEKIFREVEF